MSAAIDDIAAAIGRHRTRFGATDFFADAAGRDDVFFDGLAAELAIATEPAEPPVAPPPPQWIGREALTADEILAVEEALRADGMDPATARLTTYKRLRADIPAALAADPAEKLRREIARLAELDPIAYAAERKGAAKAAGVPAGDLDKLVAGARPKTAATREALAPPRPEPSATAVNARELLRDVHEFIGRFVVLDVHATTAITLWIAFTYFFDIAETSPRLAILSPTKRCGKTRLLELLDLLCPSAISASNLTPRAIFRVIDAEKCVLLIDEADTFTRDNDELRGLLNSGHTRVSSYVVRNVPVGDAWEPRRFSTWAPVAVAAIGKLPETWIDRSIVISMRRKLVGDRVERLTRRNVTARKEAADLASRLARLAKDHADALRDADPEPPALDSDRAIDNWSELLRIADLGGPEWGKRARAAAVALTGGDANDDSLPVKLLADIRAAIADHGDARIASTDLCQKLTALETSPWATITRGRPLTPARLVRMLAPFGVYPARTETFRGYRIADFEDAFSRYLPLPPDQSVMVSFPQRGVGEITLRKVSSENSNDTLKNAQTPSPRRSNDAMTLREGGKGGLYEVPVATTCPHGADPARCDECEIDRLARADGWRPEEEEF